LKDYLKFRYDENEVYTQTSYKQRTIDSAIAQLEGFYGKNMTWPNFDSSYSLNSVPKEKDFMLHLTDDNCPRLD